MFAENTRGLVSVGDRGGRLHVGDGQLGGDAILNGDSEPFGPGLDVQRLVLEDGRRAVDVIGEEARDPGVELLHAEARGVLVALVAIHVRRHVFQAAILGELDLRSQWKLCQWNCRFGTAEKVRFRRPRCLQVADQFSGSGSLEPNIEGLKSYQARIWKKYLHALS